MPVSPPVYLVSPPQPISIDYRSIVLFKIKCVKRAASSKAPLNSGLAVAWPTTTTNPTTTTTTALNFQPSGGLGTNSTPPFYHPLSDFDFQSLVRLTCSSHLSTDIQ